MKKSNNLFTAMLSAAALTLAVSSCTDYDYGFDQKEIEYHRNFETLFGKIDPEQTWNVAKRGTVTVYTGVESDVQVYANYDGQYALVADYKGVSGSQEISFDVRKGTTDLLVACGSQTVKTTVGGSANFGDTRTAHLYDENNIKVTLTGDYKFFSKEQVRAWMSILPEAGNRSNLSTNNGSGLGRTAADFAFVSTGDFLFYPLYWNTSGANTIGIYYEGGSSTYTNASGVEVTKNITMIPIYTIKSGSELQIKTTSSNDFKPAGNSVWSDDLVQLRSEAIKVSIPQGTRFGFYLQNANITFFSQRKRNTDRAAIDIFENGVWKELQDQTYDSDNPSTHACHAATFTYDNVTYLGFEDWTNQYLESDFDLNDVICVLDKATPGSVPTPVEEDVDLNSWLVACEDLGNTHDIDFNDVVFKVNHISGRNYAYLIPLAAGGTLESHIYFDDKDLGDKDLGEIHKMFGKSAPEIINAFERTDYGSSIQLAVSTDFSMSYLGEGGYGTNTNMGGFKIKTGSKEGEWATEAITINAPQKGDTPQMICLPAKYINPNDNTQRLDWQWPTESTNIADAYNATEHSFVDWVKDAEFNNWYMYPTGSIVADVDPEEVSETSQPGTGGNVTPDDKAIYGEGTNDYTIITNGKELASPVQYTNNY